jgi:V/A-type H+-transporting ATPase subunit B
MDDVTHPVPDNTGYITEGQFYMKDGYLELFGSLSRLKQQVNDKTRPDHRSIMNAMARLLSEAEERVKAQKFGSVKDDYSCDYWLIENLPTRIDGSLPIPAIRRCP